MAVEAGQDMGDGDHQARPVVQFDLLGPFRIRTRQADPQGMETRQPEALGRKAQALLAYLAATPGHRASRERLASLLWGERFDEQARQSLRQTLMTLRRSLAALAPGLLTAERNEVWLDAALFTTDLAAFEQADAADSLEGLRSGAALWRGAFLAGLDIPSPEYEDWLRGLRDGWRLRMTMLQLRLGHRLLEQDRHTEALRVIQVLIESDPLNEEARRLELALVARISGVAAAMQGYQRFVALLDRELGVAPEAETRALVARLGQGELPVAAAPAAVVDAVAVQPAAWWQRPLVAGGAVLVAVGGTAGALQFSGTNIQKVQQASPIAAPRAPLFAFHLADATEGDIGAVFREEMKTRIALLPAASLVSDRRASSFIVDTAVKATPDGQHAINLRLIDTAGGQTLWADSRVTQPEAGSGFAVEAATRLYAELLVVLQQRLGPPPVPPPSFQTGWDLIVGGITRERVAEGRRFFQAALDAEPDNPSAKLGMAHYISLDLTNRWSRQRDADTLLAVDYLEQVIRQSPRNLTAYFTLGLIHKTRRDYNRALTAWQVVLAIEPRDSSANAQVAHVNLLMGNVEEGLARAELAIQLHPNARAVDRAYFYAGMGHLLAGDYARAEQRLAKAIAANPALPDAFAWRVAALAQAGRQAEAEALYADMMRRFPWWNVDHHVTQAIDRRSMDRFSVGMDKVVHAGH